MVLGSLPCPAPNPSGYNAGAVVDEAHQVIRAVRLTAQTTNTRSLPALVDQLEVNAGRRPMRVLPMSAISPRGTSRTWRPLARKLRTRLGPGQGGRRPPLVQSAGQGYGDLRHLVCAVNDLGKLFLSGHAGQVVAGWARVKSSGTTRTALGWAWRGSRALPTPLIGPAADHRSSKRSPRRCQPVPPATTGMRKPPGKPPGWVIVQSLWCSSICCEPKAHRPPAKSREILIFSSDVLRIDAPRVAEDIETAIREEVLGVLRRRGAVVVMSGGIDSSVVATLCVRSLGPERVFGLLMPERDSSSDALRLGRMLAEHLEIPHAVEDIAPALTALGCYDRQLEAIRMVFPEYGEGWRCKLVLPSLLDRDRLNLVMLTVADPGGNERSSRMPATAYLQMVASTDFKQRTRKMLEYYHADRLHYAVAGTPNLLEYDQGFFVKQGDGAADFKPIAHLYKSQVYALAKHLEVPHEIQMRSPTTDTFSLPQSQEEFYFALPYREMDLCLWALNHRVPSQEAGAAMGLTAEQVERVYRDIEAKRRVSQYLHHVATPIKQGDGV